MSKKIKIVYSLEEGLKDPSLRPLAEGIILSEKNPLQGYRNKKYIKAQKNLTKIKVEKLVKAHPDWALKDILADIIKRYPADLPADVLMTMIQFIVHELDSVPVQEKMVA